MQNLIGHVEVATQVANIDTTGYKTLLCVLKGTANYQGTKEEAQALVEGTTVTLADNVSGDNAYDIDKEQYLLARTVAGTATAFLEIIFADKFVAQITLPENVTSVVNLLTFPANSKQAQGV